MSFVATALSTDIGLSSKRRQVGPNGGNKLNLVSLMDIFTILVFFLMMNTGDVEILQPDEKVVLPQSFTQHKPDTSPVIKVTADAIYFKEVQVLLLNESTSHSSINNQDNELIDNLYAQLVKEKTVLAKLAVNRSALVPSNKAPLATHSVSVMGDASVPYALLKKVLYTCAQAGFRDVSLAVEYTARETHEAASSSENTFSSDHASNNASAAQLSNKELSNKELSTKGNAAV